MRVPIIAGNWKMNTTVTEAVALVRQMKEPLDGIKGVEKVVCPPFVSLADVARELAGPSINDISGVAGGLNGASQRPHHSEQHQDRCLHERLQPDGPGTWYSRC